MKQIESVRELTAFPALGYLDVSHNPLTYEALLALRDLHIVHLVAEVRKQSANTYEIFHVVA
jgi:hypothetical protein